MWKISNTLIVGVVLCAALAQKAPAEGRRVRLGGVSVTGSYWGGSGWYPGYGRPFYRPAWGLYDPFWYSPFIHPAMYGYAHQAHMGQVKLDSVAADASIYVDGAYAGSVDKRRRFSLEPGSYDLEVRDTRDGVFKRRIYVLSGKTLDIRPELRQASGQEAKP